MPSRGSDGAEEELHKVLLDQLAASKVKYEG
jgi:hypothetical protein